jgi:hypothetical protein
MARRHKFASRRLGRTDAAAARVLKAALIDATTLAISAFLLIPSMDR